MAASGPALSTPLRNVEDLLFARYIYIWHQTARMWWNIPPLAYVTDVFEITTSRGDRSN
ncbi:hypothetical protein [Sphingomonas sp. R86521]|uniref:hypothetical protein n=1 Tax=Sphingomonas sp. R86521 TaxID=3093860 RepID=UPI0036D37D13